MKEELLGSGTAKNTGSGPGTDILLYGNSDLGFYGEISKENLPSTSLLCNTVNLTAGRLTEDVAPTGQGKFNWLKVIRNNVIFFILMASARTSWSGLNIDSADLLNAQCIYGEKTITFDDWLFKIRVLTGADVNPVPQPYNDHTGGEWNDIMYKVADGTWANYQAGDLGNDGYYSVCQETFSGTSTLISRGGDAKGTQMIDPTYLRWRPVLELVTS